MAEPHTGATSEAATGENTLQPDIETIREHLEVLFGDAGDIHDGLVEIAHGEKGPHAAHLFSTSELDAAAAYAARVNAARQVVYVGAALRKPECKRGTRTKKSDFYGATAAWCDLDDAKAVAASMATTKILPPTHGVITGRIPTTRAQLWWRIGEPITDQQQLETLLSGIRNTTAGDPSVVDSIRVMRLAGTVAWPTKKGRVAELTRLRSFTDDPGDLIALWNAYSANAERVQPQPVAGNGHDPEAAPEYDGDPADLEALRLRLRDKDTGRFDLELAKMMIRPGLFYPIMTLVTAHLIGKGVPDLIILDTGLQWGRERLGRDFNEADARVNLRRQLDGAHTKGWGPDWKEHLLRAPAKDGKAGRVIPNIENAMTALRHAPEWRGSLWLCEFSQRIMFRSPPPYARIEGWNARGWHDDDDAYTAGWLERFGSVNIGHDIAGKAAAAVAREHSYHPVRDYLDSLKWDGKPRIGSWLVTYFGADADNKIEIEFARRWLIAAVARAYRPGCKADSILVLEGTQGIGKSSGLRFLVPDEAWFTDHMPEVHSKDAMIQVQGKWIVEMAELEAFSRAEITRVKAYLSRTTDDFRPPYGRGNVRCPRSCVFAGTTNRGEYLIDDTGNRRFWTVTCQSVNVYRIAKERDQLWAEATHEFKAGEKWWVVDQALQLQVEASEVKRLDVIESWLAELDEKLTGTGETRVHVCLIDHLKFRRDQINKRHEMDVARCLSVLGFKKDKDGLGNSVWKRVK